MDTNGETHRLTAALELAEEAERNLLAKATVASVYITPIGLSPSEAIVLRDLRDAVDTWLALTTAMVRARDDRETCFSCHEPADLLVSCDGCGFPFCLDHIHGHGEETAVLCSECSR